MLEYNKNLSLTDIPDTCILNFYISQNVILVLLKDEGKFVVASFDLESKHCTNASSYNSKIEATKSFRNHITGDLGLEEENPFAGFQFGKDHEKPFKYYQIPDDPFKLPPFKNYPFFYEKNDYGWADWSVDDDKE